MTIVVRHSERETREALRITLSEMGHTVRMFSPSSSFFSDVLAVENADCLFVEKSLLPREQIKRACPAIILANEKEEETLYSPLTHPPAPALAPPYDARALSLTLEHVMASSDVFDKRNADKDEGALPALAEDFERHIAEINDMMSIVDETYTIVWVNKRTEEMYAGTHLVGMKCYTAYHGYETLCDGCLIAKTFEDGKEHEGEIEILDGEGRERTFRVTSNIALRNEDGSPRYVVESGRDVTHLREAETQIRSLAKFPSECPYPITRIAMNGNVLYSNSASAPLLAAWKYKEEGVLPQEWQDWARDVIETGEIKQVEDVCDGRTYRFTFVPIHDEHYVNVYATDVSDRKEAESALVKSRELYQSIFNASPLAFIVYDAKGIVIDWNKGARTIFGWTKEEVINKEITRFLPLEIAFPDDVRGMGQSDSGALWYHLSDVVTKNGSRVVCEWYNSVIFDKEEKPSLIISIGNNITERSKLEDELLESEIRFREIVEHLPVAFIEIDKDRKVDYSNAKGLRMFALGKSDIDAGVALDEFFVRDNRKSEVRSVIRHLMTNVQNQREERLFKRNGTQFDALVSTYPVIKDGRVIGMRMIALDNTEAKERERELESQRQMLEFLARFEKNLYSLNATLILDTTLEFLEHLTAFARMTIFDDTTVIVRGFAGIERVKYTTPRSVYRHTTLLTFSKQGAPVYEERIDESAITNDREREMIERHHLVSRFTVPISIENKYIGFIEIATCDEEGISEYARNVVTIIAPSVALALENARLYESATRNEERYRTLIEKAPEAILLVNYDTKIVSDCNEKTLTLFGITRDALPTFRIADYAPPLQPSGIRSQKIIDTQYERALQKKDVVFEFVMRTREGEDVPVEIAIVRLPSEAEPVLRVSVRDISERKRLEIQKQSQDQMLIQADKLIALGELSAGMAHEITQPLTGISLAANTLLMQVLEGETRGEYFKMKLTDIASYIERIKTIIDHVRVFSREQDSGSLEVFNIHNSVNNALSLIWTQYENYGIDLILEFTAAKTTVWGNIYRFEQVIHNLLSNAKYAVEEKAKRVAAGTYRKSISLKTYESGAFVFLEIADNGIGIPENTLKNVFTPFFTTKPHDKGTGLGLSVTYGIVKEMDGNIIVESEEGIYTVVTVKLPIAEEEGYDNN